MAWCKEREHSFDANGICIHCGVSRQARAPHWARNRDLGSLSEEEKRQVREEYLDRDDVV